MNVSDYKAGLNGRTDEDLVRQVNDGRDTAAGRAAATELLGRYRRPVYVWCYRYVGDHEHALDLSQDVLMRAWQSLETFAGRSKFSSWLFAIARNSCLNEVRRVRLFGDDEPDFDRVTDGRSNPARELEEREDENRLIGLIGKKLEPLEQKALWLRCFERLPVEEITKILDIDSVSGARGLLQKARRKLKTAIEEGDRDDE
jgi:RNA polymerase sigma-70 factor (ECF subfamily)